MLTCVDVGLAKSLAKLYYCLLTIPTYISDDRSALKMRLLNLGTPYLFFSMLHPSPFLLLYSGYLNPSKSIRAVR
ncbi:hypothetical protein F4775DRAFT_572143 [Biscogniauxia sp. FL1348]|nr:hypothetical protein F4775DRAFT_572143 [Biscogniauxia sp. FL1348]